MSNNTQKSKAGPAEEIAKIILDARRPLSIAEINKRFNFKGRNKNLPMVTIRESREFYSTKLSTDPSKVYWVDGIQDPRSAANKAPKGATHECNGLYYKTGVHGKLFFWSDGEWKLSSEPKSSTHTMSKLI